jgi:beta-1,4-mannosyl-glycoprotein beta-1,4-N-acetylglucosaminyltransferase
MERVMARYWHPFMFYNELDWLECQLWETYDQMHRYILVEATLDHQGHPKPLVYEQNKARFARWSDKIIHVVVTDLPTVDQSSNHWDRERRQRDAAMPVLISDARDDDYIINMDVDEVPSQVTMTAEPIGISGLNLSNHLFAVDWFAEWNVMGSMLPRYCLNTSMEESDDLAGAVIGGLSWIREHRYGWPVIDKAGWHFSWVGSVEEYIEKDKRTPHVEHHDDRVAPGAPERNVLEGGGQTPVDVGDDWPRYIRERACPPSWFRPRDGS